MTLVALSSMAVGAVPEGTTETIWKLDFASSGTTVSSKKDGVTLTNPWPSSTGTGSSYTTDGLEIRQSSNIQEVYHFQQTAGKLTFADEFTMVLTLKYDSHNGDYPVLFGLGSVSDHEKSKDWKVTYYVPSDGDPGSCFVLDNDGYQVNQVNRGSGDIEVTAGKTYTLTLYNSGSYKGADSGRVELYVGNTLAGYSVFDNTQNLNTLSVQHFSLGGRIYDDNNGSNITVSSAALYKYVPEPTTATLSLLALAGLAARRRRR